MPGFMPGIHVFLLSLKQDVDARRISAFTRVFRRAMAGPDDREAGANYHGGSHFFFF